MKDWKIFLVLIVAALLFLLRSLFGQTNVFVAGSQAVADDWTWHFKPKDLIIADPNAFTNISWYISPTNSVELRILTNVVRGEIWYSLGTNSVKRDLWTNRVLRVIYGKDTNYIHLANIGYGQETAKLIPQ